MPRNYPLEGNLPILLGYSNYNDLAGCKMKLKTEAGWGILRNLILRWDWSENAHCNKQLNGITEKWGWIEWDSVKYDKINGI